MYWTTSNIPVNLEIHSVSELHQYVSVPAQPNTCASSMYQMINANVQGLWFSTPEGIQQCVWSQGPAGWLSGCEAPSNGVWGYEWWMNGSTIEVMTPYWHQCGNYPTCDRGGWAYSYAHYHFGNPICNSWLPTPTTGLVDVAGNPVTLPDSVNGFWVKVCKVEHQKCQCNLTTTSLSGDIFNPNLCQPLNLSGSVMEAYNNTVEWTVNILGRTYSGLGTSVSVAGDGKDTNGNLVAPGSYSAILNAKVPNSICSDSKTAEITMQGCNLSVSLSSSNSPINPSSGETINFPGVFPIKQLLRCLALQARLLAEIPGMERMHQGNWFRPGYILPRRPPPIRVAALLPIHWQLLCSTPSE